jgi:site-specific DNA recombinase
MAATSGQGKGGLHLTWFSSLSAARIAVVLAQDRDRFAREPAYLYLLKEEFAPKGCALRAMNGRGDESPEGELTDGVLDQLAKYERAKFMERARRGKLQKARQGKVPGRRPRMGFAYRDGEYSVDETRMAHVRRIFRMVGVEGHTLASVKRTFEAEGVRTQGGGRRWDATVIRRMIDNDVYFPHSRDEVAALVSPEVAARLDPAKEYGVYWFNRKRHKKNYAGPTRNVREHNDPSVWIAVPVPDAGVPREWAEKARAAVEDNARPHDAGLRFWELKSLLLCPCGRRLTTFVARRKYENKGYLTYHYVCSHQRRHGAGSCEHARYHNAEKLEGRVRRLVLDLVRRPEVMMERVREDVERERERLRNADRERAAWLEELAKAERRRDALIEMRADGDITKEEYREKAAGLDASRAAAERELAALGSRVERARYLDALPGLVEEYVRDLPDLVHGTAAPVRDHETVPPARTEGSPLRPYRLGPKSIRRRTPEEMEELRLARERERGRRYRAVYELLGLKAVAHKDGTLEISGAFGLGESKPGDGRPAAGEPVPPPEDLMPGEEDRCQNRRSPRPSRFRESRGARGG